MPQKKKCLVTGAGGFLGATLVRTLLDKGYEVRALLQKNEPALNLHQAKIELFIGDILDRKGMADAMRGVHYVFHAASLYEATPFYDSFPKRMYEINIEGTRNLLEAATQAGVEKVIYTSSAGTIGLPQNGAPANEGMPFNCLKKRSHYEKSKAKAEFLALEFHKKGLAVVSINPSFMIGAGDLRPSPTGEVIIKYLNKKYPCYFEAVLRFSDLESVVEAHLQAIEFGKSGERYLVVADEVFTLKEFHALLEEVSGVRRPKIKLPITFLLLFSILNEALLAILGLAGKVKPLIAYELLRYLTLKADYDGSKAKRELGYTSRPIKKAVEEAVQWFTENGRRIN